VTSRQGGNIGAVELQKYMSEDGFALCGNPRRWPISCSAVVKSSLAGRQRRQPKPLPESDCQHSQTSPGSVSSLPRDLRIYGAPTHANRTTGSRSLRSLILQNVNACLKAPLYTRIMNTLEKTLLLQGSATVRSILTLIGRVLFALVFIAAAPRHFTQEGISHAADLGVPFANLFVPISGILAIAGGLSIATGFHAKFGALTLILFLVPVTLGMHQFWNIEDPLQRHIQLAMFGKNISMLGAAICLFYNGSGPFSLRG
jgi:putative oxidoreductase